MKKIYHWFLTIFCVLSVFNITYANEYTDAGAPPTDRVWTADDYQQFAQVLQSGKVALPTFKTVVGKRYIERMTSLDNLDALQDDSLSIDKGFEISLSMIEGFSPIVKMYVVSLMISEGNGIEAMRMLAFSYRIGMVVRPWMYKKSEIIPKDDTYLIRLEGIRKMELGIMEQFIGILMSFDEIQGLTDEDKLFAVQALRQDFSEVSLLFSKEQRKEIEKRIIRLQKTMPKQASKLLQEMRDILQKQQ